MEVSKIKFTSKVKLFIEEYLIDFNATQAAIRAGYSEKTAYSIGHENLRKPEIWAEIEKTAQKRMDKVKVTAEMVLKELGLIAFSTTGDYKPADKIKCLELLGKNLVLFTDKRAIDVTEKKVTEMTDAELYEALGKSKSFSGKS